jgi:hypothetical protein
MELDRTTFAPFNRKDSFYSSAYFSGSNDDQVAYGLDDPSGIYVWSLPLGAAGKHRKRSDVDSITKHPKHT